MKAPVYVTRKLDRGGRPLWGVQLVGQTSCRIRERVAARHVLAHEFEDAPVLRSRRGLKLPRRETCRMSLSTVRYRIGIALQSRRAVSNSYASHKRPLD